MAGPYPPEYGAGPVGPQIYPYPDNVPSAYPGMLPPPVPYAKKRRWPLIVGALAAVLVIGAVVAAIVFATRGGDQASSQALTDESAMSAIQEYLDAMTNGDDETVARHTLCGMFGAVKERRSDLALASLSSDAFRKQYSSAEVAAIDKIVMWSPHQAQVLFSMRAEPARGSSRGAPSADEEQQAVAQLLIQDGEVLVCSYLPRAAGLF